MTTARILLKGVRNLPKADIIGTCDSFLVASLGSQKYKTKVIWNQYEGHWNEGCDFEFSDDDSTLVVEVYDKDMLSDEFIGSTRLNLRELLLSAENSCPFTVVDQELDICDRNSKPVTGYSGAKTTVILAAYLIGVITPSSLVSYKSARGLPVEKTGLFVTLKEVHHLPKMDLIGTCDAYAIASSGGRQV